MRKKIKELKSIRKPRLYWYKGKIIERISDKRKGDSKKLRKRWKAERNGEF